LKKFEDILIQICAKNENYESKEKYTKDCGYEVWIFDRKANKV